MAKRATAANMLHYNDNAQQKWLQLTPEDTK